MEKSELDRIIDWCRIPVVAVKFTVECEGCGKEYQENDGYRGCCSEKCFCSWSCIGD
jgi:hypothetical protein